MVVQVTLADVLLVSCIFIKLNKIEWMFSVKPLNNLYTYQNKTAYTVPFFETFHFFNKGIA